MKILKITLAAIYPILIILLLLSNCRGCKQKEIVREVRSRVDTVVLVVPDTTTHAEPVDTTVAEPAREDSALIDQAQQTGQSGDLKVTLLWNFPADIDVHVRQPNGRTIFYANRSDSSTGGYLDVDNQEGGRGAAENIYWENPPRGKYQVKLHYYQSSRANGVAGRGKCTVVVFQKGQEPKTYDIHMNHVDETKNVTTITI